MKKFYSKLKQENILVKMSMYNYMKIIAKKTNCHKIYKYLMNKKFNFLKTHCNKIVEYLHYLKNNNIDKWDNEIKEIKTFVELLIFTFKCESYGKIISFENIQKTQPDDVKDVDYVFSTDVFVNLKGFNNLGDDLSYLYYRSRLIKYDMPMFLSKELKQKFDDFIKEKTGEEPIEFVGMAYTSPLNFRAIYNKQELKEKELYESVFSEFGLKYEDRESEYMEVYTLDFKDKYM